MMLHLPGPRNIIWSMKRTVSLTTIVIVLQYCLNYYSLSGRYRAPDVLTEGLEHVLMAWGRHV